MSFLQMSVAGAVMILVVTVLRALAMNRVPKKTFPVLWGAVLARLLIPFSLPSHLSIYSLLKRSAAPVSANAPAAMLPIVSPQQTAALPAQPAATPGTALSPWSMVWIAGMILCAVVFAVTYWKCYREFQTSLPVENDTARRWLQAHPLWRTISIRQSDRISSPLTFGILHPVILMPKKTDWEDDLALRYVLEHEFVHIRRWDTLSKLLLIAAVCAHWFNPLVWVMYVLANRDLELSCDETVVRHFGSGTRASYAKVLIRMEETRSGFAPLCNHFSKNAIEERITAIMKTKKTTMISLILAAMLVSGTVTVFATSAQNETTPAAAPGAVAEENNNNPSESTEAWESGEGLTPSAEYAAAGITRQENLWVYQGNPIAGIYDDNDGIYTDEKAEDGIYLHILRDDQNGIADVSVVTKKQFRELVDRHMNLISSDSAFEQNTLLSYVDPKDGKTYYSFDDGKTFQPLTNAEFEALYPTPDIEWWTYDEYKAWLDNEKVALQSLLGETAWTGSDGSFVWTQEKIDETIALYESILKDIQNGMMVSKTVDGQDDVMVSYHPADVVTSTDDVTRSAPAD